MEQCSINKIQVGFTLMMQNDVLGKPLFTVPITAWSNDLADFATVGKL